MAADAAIPAEQRKCEEEGDRAVWWWLVIDNSTALRDHTRRGRTVQRIAER